MDKKGQVGFKLAQAIFLILVVLVVLGVAGMLVAVSMRDVSDTIDKTSVTVNNETTGVVVETGADLDYVSADGVYRKSVCTILEVINATNQSEAPFTTGNYTLTNSDCTISFKGADVNKNNTGWNVSYSVTYIEPRITAIAQNYSGSISEFFGNTSTIISILIVVIIISLIGVVILVISVFGRGRGAGGLGAGRGRGREFGSDTVGGI